MADKPEKLVPAITHDKIIHHLGQTRSSFQADHALLTPDTFVRAPLPGMKNATAIIHAAPAMGAAFTQYTAEMDERGALGPAEAQRFIFVLDGEVHIQAAGKKCSLAKGGYAFTPSGAGSNVGAAKPSRIAVIEKTYQPLRGVRAPGALIGDETSVIAQPFMGDESLQVRSLLPDSPGFDFAVNTMTYKPGATLPMVESHVMEHGLLMLEGDGIYRLGDRWYPVTAGDFIWMGPIARNGLALWARFPQNT